MVEIERRATPRGVLIACASPSLRVQLATRYIDEEPVVLASGERGMLEHLQRAIGGRGLLPALVLVGSPERRALERTGWAERLERAGVSVLDAAPPIAAVA